MEYIGASMGRDKSKKRLDLQLTSEQVERLTEHAVAQRRSTKNMAELILAEYIANLPKSKKKKS